MIWDMLPEIDFIPRVQVPQLDTLDFDLPQELEASEPPEARGLKRDEVGLMVSYISNNRIVHTQFRQIVDYLEAGDVLVINTSGTMNAAIEGVRMNGEIIELHLSTRLPSNDWVVELRSLEDGSTKPFYEAEPSEIITLPDNASVRLIAPYAPFKNHIGAQLSRLWVAELTLPYSLDAYLEIHGFPIRYGYVNDAWDTDYYQTVYATEKGSAEMPSAGRAFTESLITKLVAKGVQVLPIVLHTGVASLEDHEPPYQEYYQVPDTTALAINSAKLLGRRVIAVGTTVVRALETVTDKFGVTYAGAGWTEILITPERGIFAVNGMLTGLHEPKATHLAMLAALTGKNHLRLTYHEALKQHYLWHEFGDLHLILP